jgi:hypothetical protein
MLIEIKVKPFVLFNLMLKLPVAECYALALLSRADLLDADLAGFLDGRSAELVFSLRMAGLATTVGDWESSTNLATSAITASVSGADNGLVPVLVMG